MDGLENVGKRTPSDPMETGCRGKNPSDCCACQFARDLVNIHQSRVVEGMVNVGKRTPSDPMETGCRGKNPSDRCMSVRERLSKYTSK